MSKTDSMLDKKYVINYSNTILELQSQSKLPDINRVHNHVVWDGYFKEYNQFTRNLMCIFAEIANYNSKAYSMMHDVSLTMIPNNSKSGFDKFLENQLKELGEKLSNVERVDIICKVFNPATSKIELKLSNGDYVSPDINYENYYVMKCFPVEFIEALVKIYPIPFMQMWRTGGMSDFKDKVKKIEKEKEQY